MMARKESSSDQANDIPMGRRKRLWQRIKGQALNHIASELETRPLLPSTLKRECYRPAHPLSLRLKPELVSSSSVLLPSSTYTEMPKSQPQGLSIAVPQKTEVNDTGLKSPQTPHHSPTGLGRKRFQYGNKQFPSGAASPDLSALPALPQSPTSPQNSHNSQKPRSREESSKSNKGRMFGPMNKRRLVPTTASSTQLDTTSSTRRPFYDDTSSSVASMSHGNLLETSSVQTGTFYVEPTPIENKQNDEMEDDRDVLGPELKSNSLPKSDSENLLQKKLGKPVRFDRFLSRTRSVRQDHPENPPPRTKTREGLLEPGSFHNRIEESPKTAPLEHERSFRDLMGSAIRNKSADRHAVDSDGEQQQKPSSNRGDGRFIQNLKMSSNKAADGIGRMGKGLMGKFNRSGSNGEASIPDDPHYKVKYINLPLVEQTRRTRIRKSMADARDKTEFWMPALPYRCIDFLNLKGIEEEGLYRVPGNTREIRYWEKRFDIEGDVNLLDESELYDINIVGSMLKSWLRNLPERLFPQSLQDKVLSQCEASQDEPPQVLRDTLSELPPQNYYVLFAVTCHIALLFGHSQSNKMTFNNLCVCFQPCLRVDGVIFRWLVCRWKQCWQGCTVEGEYLEEEYRAMLNTSKSNAGRKLETPVSHQYEESAVYSNSSSRPATTGSRATPPQSRRPSSLASSSKHDLIREEPSPKKSPALAGRSTPDHPPSLEPVGSVSPMRM